MNELTPQSQNTVNPAGQVGGNQPPQVNIHVCRRAPGPPKTPEEFGGFASAKGEGQCSAKDGHGWNWAQTMAEHAIEQCHPRSQNLSATARMR